MGTVSRADKPVSQVFFLQILKFSVESIVSRRGGDKAGKYALPLSFYKPYFLLGAIINFNLFFFDLSMYDVRMEQMTCTFQKRYFFNCTLIICNCIVLLIVLLSFRPTMKDVANGAQPRSRGLKTREPGNKVAVRPEWRLDVSITRNFDARTSFL